MPSVIVCFLLLGAAATANFREVDLLPREEGFLCYSCNYAAYGITTYFNTFKECSDPYRNSHVVSTVRCSTACFSRHDKNGFIYRGCFAGNLNVDASQDGCGSQEGANWCFCRGNLCNDVIPHATCPFKGIGHRHKRCVCEPPRIAGAAPAC
ncbi:uncharacterized protein LOC106153474 [Lingula anatina]|uniref:Uncharacterized protein LOC106153474 n=1 Tax=Lingula anatina TaxID=7574 RepID=A0A1S3HA34_LINAN|nr:uncharacterized protein LOC106153474 [Lingula anatina]|eukprot:XP_013382868.1 uncharacterized protein LOC106153474 [Lingula anatina]